jgi:hypothetical protein
LKRVFFAFGVQIRESDKSGPIGNVSNGKPHKVEQNSPLLEIVCVFVHWITLIAS